MTEKFYNRAKHWGLMETFFSDEEINIIKKRIQNLKILNIAFCSFENRFAKSGGLAAVTTKILPHLAKVRVVQRVILLTPFYPRLIKNNKLEPSGIKSFNVFFNGKYRSVELLKYTLESPPLGGLPIEEYYIKAKGFFETHPESDDPYSYQPNSKTRNENALVKNSLFYCKVIPYAVKALGIRDDIVFHLQEWQTALITLTAKKAILEGVISSCGTVQTIHNPFDSWFSPDTLRKGLAEKPSVKMPLSSLQNGYTAYKLGLQLVDAPATTVSKNFAREFISDPLHTKYFAKDLQDIFKEIPIQGVNNGLFIDFPPEFSRQNHYSIDEIKTIKLKKRNRLLGILATNPDENHFGELTYEGKSIARLPEKVPIIMMSGRLDPFQKGFDILLQVIERYTTDQLKVILTPMTTNHNDLEYFYRVAQRCRGNVMVFTSRLKEWYPELQMGCTFGIMPSIYEPFGAAIEYMVSGTVTIARQTGGLADQIHHRKCGYLFRENPKFYNLKNILAFSRNSDQVTERKKNPWVQDMVKKLHQTMEEAINTYQTQADDYYRMIKQGFKQARTFSWQKSAEEYVKIYQKIKEL